MEMKLIYWGMKYTTTEKNTVALVVASMEIGLQVIANKTKYMVMS